MKSGIALGDKVKVREFTGTVNGWSEYSDSYLVLVGNGHEAIIPKEMVEKEVELIDRAIYQDGNGDLAMYQSDDKGFQILTMYGNKSSDMTVYGSDHFGHLSLVYNPEGH